MARRDKGGCVGLILGLMVAPCALSLGLGIPSIVLAAPAITAYASVSHATEFAPYRHQWLLFSAAAPLLAIALVRLASPRIGRLRGRRRLVMRRWDRRPEPVTVESVRAAAQYAGDALRHVKAENQRMTRLARQIEAELSAARSATNFAVMCNLHFESFNCADGAHGHYRSTQTSLQTMAQMLGQVRGASRRWRGPAGRPLTERARQHRAQLDGAAADLAHSSGQLGIEVERGLVLVQSLNANTAELKHSIRERCGERGQRWYDGVEERAQSRSNQRRRSYQRSTR